MRTTFLPLFRRLQHRIERSCERLGVSYPWWIPAYSSLACVALTVAAFVQRGGFTASLAVIGGFALSLATLIEWIFTGQLRQPWVNAVVMTVAVALYLTTPVSPDLAPLLFLIMVGETAATASIRLSLVVAAVGVGVLAVAASLGHLGNITIYVIGVVLGADVGIALRWQMRALGAERRSRAIGEERVLLAERQRLAREVHDVVGHSLSINLLHVTAARHALQQHADIADAIDALTEAERVGRAAMGDLRRTVAVLAAGPSETQPLPGVDDMDALIERSRSAGLDVDYERDCAGSLLSDAASLGLYRIMQESLANMAKHAPRGSGTVSIVAESQQVTLRVRNTVAGGRPIVAAGGRGLPGMAARAEQMGAELRAGPDGDCWLVEVVVPVGTAESTPAAAL